MLHRAALSHGPSEDNVTRDDIPAFHKICPEREDDLPCGRFTG